MTVHELTHDLCARINDPGGKRTYTKMLRCVLHAIQDQKIHLIPGIKSYLVTVEDNLTAVLKDGAIDVIQAGKYVAYDEANQFVYPLTKKENVNPFELIVKPSVPFGCPEIPPAPDDVEKQYQFHYENYTGLFGLTLWYMPSWYGEMYGYQETRFFGAYSYEKKNNRIVFDWNGCVKPGDQVIVKVKTYDEDDLTSTIDPLSRAMLHHRALQYYWEDVSQGRSQNHFIQFKREIRMYKQSRNSWSLQEVIDSITSAYTNTPI